MLCWSVPSWPEADWNRHPYGIARSLSRGNDTTGLGPPDEHLCLTLLLIAHEL